MKKFLIIAFLSLTFAGCDTIEIGEEWEFQQIDHDKEFELFDLEN